MSTCDTPIWISSSSVPRSRARTTRRSRPQATSATETTVSAARTQTTRRRKSSRTVSCGDRDHVGSSRSASSSRKAASSDPRPGSTAWTRPPPATSAATRSGIRSAAERPDRQPLPVDGRRAEGGRDRPAGVGQTGHAQANAVDGDDLVERAGRDRAAVVEDDDAVAHPLDLGQQMRVEDDRRSPVARRADDRPDVLPAERVERRRRLVEEHELRDPRAARRPARAAAASPSRSRSPASSARSARPDPVERLVDDSPSVGRRRSGRAARGARGPRGHAARAGSGRARAGSRSAPAPRGRRARAPSTRPLPAVGRASPSRSLIVVVLPAPLGPSSPTISPRPTTRSSPARAVVVPYVLTIPSSSITAVDTLAVTSLRQGSGHSNL